MSNTLTAEAPTEPTQCPASLWCPIGGDNGCPPPNDERVKTCPSC